MSDIDGNVEVENEKTPLQDKIEDDFENLKDNRNDEDNSDEEMVIGGGESPTPSIHSNCSSSDEEGPPESAPSLDDPYPESKLYIYPPQKIHTCPKCKEVLREPVKIKACGHHLCYKCYEEVSSLTKRCPLDQMEFKGNARVDKEFRDEIIMELDVRCRNVEQRCKWEGTIKDFAEHVQYCDYNLMSCVCGASFPKRFQQKHRDKECGKEEIKCEDCNADINREDKKSHLNECPKRRLPCPNKCDRDLVLPRDEIDRHLDLECPRKKIICRYENIGCSHTTSREKMVKHYNKEIITHVEMLHDQESDHDDLLKKILDKLREHEIVIENEDERIGDIEKINNTQLIWKIEDFSSKMSQAKGGSTETIFHPPFTTSKHGYRLSASVCLNGDGKGKGTHMSVFLCIHKGDYDVFLKWQFDYRVTFTLLDQNENLNERQHIKLSIKPNPSPDNEKFLGRPTMEKNASFGVQLFATHEEIQSRNYIKDNTILLKISVDCAGTDAVYLA